MRSRIEYNLFLSRLEYLQDLRGNPHRDYLGRISRSFFLKKGVDEKWISPVEKNMTWQISISEMFPYETEIVKEVKILVNNSSIEIIVWEMFRTLDST